MISIVLISFFSAGYVLSVSKKGWCGGGEAKERIASVSLDSRKRIDLSLGVGVLIFWSVHVDTAFCAVTGEYNIVQINAVILPVLIPYIPHERVEAGARRPLALRKIDLVYVVVQ